MLGCLYCAQAYLGQAIPDRTYWGVDSATAANVTNTEGKDFFQLVKEMAEAQPGGTAPRFWGRYIGSSFSLTRPEALHLHRSNCRILLIYNGHAGKDANGNPYNRLRLSRRARLLQLMP